jgi:hypothetical protein
MILALASLMRRMPTRFAISAALLLLAAACHPATPAARPAIDPPAAELDSARRAWTSRGIRSYAYTMEISCFCIHRGRYNVEVRDGQLASVRDAQTGAPSPESRVEWILTVDQLFERMGQAEQVGTRVRAVYDARLGYPSEVEIGLLANDSGTLYRIEGLRPL